MKGNSAKLNLYILFISMLGVFSLYMGFKDITLKSLPILFFLTLLGIIAESVAIKINDSLAISVSFGVGVAAILILESSSVSIIGFFSMLLYFETVDGKVQHILNTPLKKRIFNGSGFSFSLLAAQVIYSIINQKIDWVYFQGYNLIGIIVIPIIFSSAQTTIYILLQAIIERKHFFKLIGKETILVFVVDFIAILPFGIIIAALTESYGMFAAILFFGPLLLARYSFKLYLDMKKMYSDTIIALSNAIDAKDRYTNGHSHRVADLAVEISRILGFTEGHVNIMRTAAILHDIGKIGIDDYILNKPSKLEDYEFEEIKKHPSIGANIIDQVENLSEVAEIIRYHHERYDGKGYPSGIKENMIPIESSILAVSDAFDAMTTDRPYRRAMSISEAVYIINLESGKQFNPFVVKAFNKYINSKESFENVS